MLFFWIESSTPKRVTMLPDSSSTRAELLLAGVPVIGREARDGRGHSPALSRCRARSTPGIFLFFFSFCLLTIELLFRWIVSKHIPLSNLYESLLFLNWNFIGIYFFLTRQRSRAKPRATNVFFGSFNTETTQGPAFGLESSEVGSISGDFPGPLLIDELQPASSSALEGEATLNLTTQNNNAILLGPLLSSIVLFIQTFADWQLPDEMKQVQPLIPALQSNWLLMHVSIMILSYAALFLGSILSIVYLGITISQAQNIDDRSRAAGLRAAPTKDPAEPATERDLKTEAETLLLELDSLSYRILAFGFPLLTLGILSGSIWANEAWGSYWSWDPKETWALITWLIYAVYLHTRLQYNWQGIKSAYVASGGFFIVWVCYLGVNLLGQGLHSYGWITK